MKHITQILAAAASSMVVSVPAYAETTLTVHYPMPGFFKDVMDTISKKFMEENPDIKIQFAAPSATYEEGIQTILRQAGTSEMPDVTFIGLNRLRMLDQIIAIEQKNAHLPDVELDPVERHFRQQCRERLLAFADLDDEDAFVGQMIRRLDEDAHREVEPVVARAQT